MMLGQEQRFNPEHSFFEKLYIRLFGIPILGLRIRARNVFSLIPTDRSYGRILDAGSGTGVMVFEMGRRYPSASVVGIDEREDAVRSGKVIAEKIRSSNVHFHRAKAETFESDAPFDLVLCVDILEHAEDDVGVLRNIHRLASPGGILLLHVPALYRRYPVWRRQLNFEVPTHVRRGYEVPDIVEKVDKAGFAVVDKGMTYGFWESLANNLSYMITKADMKNKALYAVLFPFLHVLSLLGATARPKTLGAGIYVLAKK